MNIEFRTITQSDSIILNNLFHFYLYELSAYSMEDVSNEGKYEAEDISPYYRDDRLFPYLIMVDNKIAGFILVTSPPYVTDGIDYSVQELFLLPKYRGKGLGRAAALHIFKHHHGHYEISMFRNNPKAVKFWSALLSSLHIDAASDIGIIQISEHKLPTQTLRFVISNESLRLPTRIDCTLPL
ncbi:GNAT family N-acetyltransferase [Paenibacillus lutrae]|uniref:GNAT family N-acetyltransferase n=1 Tax=Paenibacillus lutrae TaxID=2078573 RepID=A0A7X3FII2_9BACL|nr:GNAT family N-acetyltransferase [Paenibacillus lutrae]MVP00285.1 GNAT family N-acetyltransferase [Paenibacillus lutrae]